MLPGVFYPFLNLSLNHSSKGAGLAVSRENNPSLRAAAAAAAAAAAGPGPLPPAAGRVAAPELYRRLRPLGREGISLARSVHINIYIYTCARGRGGVRYGRGAGWGGGAFRCLFGLVVD